MQDHRTTTDNRADDLIRRHERLSATRAGWESHWREIAERILPRQDSFQNKRSDMGFGGEKRNEKIFDSTAPIALERFAAAMESMLTPRAQRWHRLRASDQNLNEADGVRDWFRQAEDILFAARYSPRANYASQQHETYMSLGAFGTGVLYVGEEVGRGLRYKSIHLADCCFAEDANGRIDTVFRKYRLTARQAAQRWSEKDLPRGIARALEQNPEQPFDFLHAVLPREEARPGRADARNLPFASFHLAVEDRAVMQESGFALFPYAVSRYVTAPNEIYGRSPAMAVLPDIKMLNEMSKTVIRAAHKTVDPPVLIHDDGILGGRPDLRPNAINYGGIDSTGRPLMQPFHTNARVDIGLDMMNQRREVINDAFLVSLFQILVQGPVMTATEVLQRAQEKGVLLGPTVGRQQSESLGPMIERELDILARADALPPMPPALLESKGDYEILYDSPLTRAQKAEEGLGVMRALEIAGAMAAADPTIFDHFDSDAVAKIAVEVHGVEHILRKKEDVEALRGQRAQQQAMSQTLAAGPQVADTVSKLSNADLSGVDLSGVDLSGLADGDAAGSGLEAMLAQMAGGGGGGGRGRGGAGPDAGGNRRA
jgi:hypothetical protein